MSEFSKRFRLLQENAGITQKELANKLDIPASTLSYYLNGREPDYKTLCKIAVYFNVSVDWLIGFSQDMNYIYMQNEVLRLTKENKKLRMKLKTVVECIEKIKL